LPDIVAGDDAAVNQGRSALESMYPMHRIAGDHEDRPYDAMLAIDYIGCRPHNRRIYNN
jgi:hypothetical protein